jgi:hypothetical protein
MEINGKPVVDATRKLTINITRADTVKGANKDPGACAAARACIRTPKTLSARVHLGRVYIEQKDKWLRFQTPGALRSEIIAFDRGGKFEPGEYKLVPVSPANQEKFRKRASGSDTNRNQKRPSHTKSPRKLLAMKHRSVPNVRSKGANR